MIKYDMTNVEDTMSIKLSKDESIHFAESLINPPEPNDALKEAKRLHDENVEDLY